jgi:heat shock protein HtpX
MILSATGLTTQIQNNHFKSAILLAGFPFLLVTMAGAFCGGLDILAQRNGIDWRHALMSAEAGIVEFGPGAVIFAAVWFVIAYFFHGGMMRMAAHSRPVTRDQLPRVYNLLENLCISRGLKMPAFEMIDSPALNAFASGIDDKSWRITLTRGLVEALEDDELEAVLGHELTHIMNRDARLLVVAVIFTGMISFFAQLFYRLLVHGMRPNYYARRSADEERGRQASIVVLLLGLAVLAVGYLFAVAIRFALSRKREYLADLGSVGLTKNPEAMMRALLRIKGHDAVTGMPNQVQQMCIENSQDFMGIFSTHPPIEDRIQTISETTRTPIPALPATDRRVPDAPMKGPWGARA